MSQDSEPRCDFCGEWDVRLIHGPSFIVCVECLGLCNEILDQNMPEAPEKEPVAVSEPFKDEYLYSLTSAVLDALALCGEPQPYSKVAPIVGYHHRSKAFFRQLGRSLREDHAAGKPLRASLVINKSIGMPGNSYFEVCRDLGYNMQLAGGEQAFWGDQVKKFL